MPKTIIAGGSGFLGRALARALVTADHDVVFLTRGAARGPSSGGRAVSWTPDGTIGPWAREIDGATAVVNLAGESIAGRRWNAAHKRRVLDSRVLATRSLAAAVTAAALPPQVFVNGSAVGYYGPRGEELVTEDTPPGTDFLAKVAVEWEAEAQAVVARSRLVFIRTGIVLDRDEGALPQMLPPFWFGVGGPVGSGRQYWPWIHRADWVDLVRFAIQSPAAAGPLNATAPNPVTNAEFAAALGRVLHRPAVMRAPGFALKLILGEMAGPLLLSGQRAVPARSEAIGVTFTYKLIEEALRSIFNR
jgi:uncharacterized protein (TIGR01777 family)